MEPPRTTRRRWVRYSLRTLFVLMTLVCIYLGWAMNWIRQRHEFISHHAGEMFDVQDNSVSAPLTLRPLGEPGHATLVISPSDEEVRKAQILFPEAKVSRFHTCVLGMER